MRERVIEPEWLDHAPQDEARANLRDIIRLNERFGGHSVLEDAMMRVAQPDESFTLLDVGAASGDTALFLQKKFPNAVVTSLDINAVNIERAQHPKVIADGFALPFGDASFDFVFSSLFLHHFTDQQVKALLRGFHAVARKAVVLSDLERHILSYFFLPATQVLFGWHRITVHDGPVSVRAAFRREELQALGEAAGLCNMEVRVHRPAFRLSAVARK